MSSKTPQITVSHEPVDIDTSESRDSDLLVVQVPNDHIGQRLDQVAALLFPDFSRARLQEWIKSGNLLVNGAVGKPKNKLTGGEELSLAVVTEPQGDWVAEDVPLDVVFEDEQVIVINKPAGMVVHPAVGNLGGTLLNGLLYAYPELLDLPRAGIVHRLDKDTTGLLVVARTLKAHQSLVSQLQARSMGREYVALAWGRVPAKGTIDEPIGRHPTQRQKMAVIVNTTITHPSSKFAEVEAYVHSSKSGKEAITHYEVKHRFAYHSLVKLKLESGRTHQIRVHLAHIGFPIVGDQTYGKKQRYSKEMSAVTKQLVTEFPRQALHARRLTLLHPDTREEVSWEVELPKDMDDLIEALKTEDEK